MDPSQYFNTNYPSITYLKERAKKNIPGFAFDYLAGGANEEINLSRNRTDLKEIQLSPEYLKSLPSASIKSELFGIKYDAPFGVAPIGLQGLIWPKSPIILAKASASHNIPFVLSTVSTSSIEQIGKITDGEFWFQLYHPSDDIVKEDLLSRAASAGCKTLVALADTPSFGIRYKDVKNGLAIPPRMTSKNILQIMGKPRWAIHSLGEGIPQFATLKPYMSKGLSLRQLGRFMNAMFNGRLNEEKIALLRDQWKGNLVIKGVTSNTDVEKAIQLGVDGIIVSNHGGRQIDAGESSIVSLGRLSAAYGHQITIMMDGGIRSGPDIARCFAAGAQFVFMGRPFMYGVAALGNKGGDHTVNLFKMQLQQVMEQLGCEDMIQLPNHLIK